MLHEANLRCDGMASKQNFRLCDTGCLRQILEKGSYCGEICVRVAASRQGLIWMFKSKRWLTHDCNWAMFRNVVMVKYLPLEC